MSADETMPLFFGGIQFVILFGAMYYFAWAAQEPRPSPIKHTAISLLLGDSLFALLITVFKMCMTGFNSPHQYISEVSTFVIDYGGKVTLQLSLFSTFLWAVTAAFLRWGPTIFADGDSKKIDHTAKQTALYKNLNEKERTEVKIELLEEILQAERRKLKDCDSS